MKFVHDTSVLLVERPKHILQRDHHESICATSLTFPYIAVVFDVLLLKVTGGRGTFA